MYPRVLYQTMLYRAIGLPTAPRDKRPIAAIARAQHRPVDELIAALQNAIMHARMPDLPPGPLPATDTGQHTPGPSKIIVTESLSIALTLEGQLIT